jgi:hypothetical protein
LSDVCILLLFGNVEKGLAVPDGALEELIGYPNIL